jgi:hypothetical protein
VLAKKALAQFRGRNGVQNRCEGGRGGIADVGRGEKKCPQRGRSRNSSARGKWMKIRRVLMPHRKVGAERAAAKGEGATFDVHFTQIITFSAPYRVLGTKCIVCNVCTYMQDSHPGGSRSWPAASPQPIDTVFVNQLQVSESTHLMRYRWQTDPPGGTHAT